MALKQLMIAKKIEQRKALLNELLEKENELKTRSEELEKAIEEAQTEEEVATVEEEVEKLEEEQKELNEKKSKLEGEIAELEGELEQLNSKEPNNNERGKEAMPKHQKRVNQQEYFTREVEEFYSELRSRLKMRANGQVLPPGERVS